MKIWALSDLHLEMSGIDRMDIPVADVCVVAGDVYTKGLIPSLAWLDRQIAIHMPVVFVAGNHEYYRSFFLDSLEAARSYQPEGQLHFLEDSSVTIGDVAFFGCTLWTDFDLFGEEAAFAAQRTALEHMNDYRLIKYSKKPYSGFYPKHSFQKHAKSRMFLEERSKEHAGKTVFVTHHAPSMRSVEPQYRDDVLTAAYASNLELLMDDGGPSLWIHGHVHHRLDYQYNATRVICNPRGYPDEKSFQDFSASWVVEV